MKKTFLWSEEHGEVTNPATGDIVLPWVPVSGHVSSENDDRRIAFTQWLTSENNPLFARIEVNRIWAQVMGRGIVEPFDDYRDSNPAANPSLLDALAEDFIDHQYDRKHILRTILNSHTYQASSQANRFNQDDTNYFSHYQPRMLTAEQLVDALGYVTGRPEKFYGVPEGTKATWLPAPDLKPHDRARIGEIEFLKVFGQPERQSACECERTDDVSLGQALELINGKLLSNMLTDKKNFFHQLLDQGVPAEQVAKRLYLRAFSRPPTEDEVKVYTAFLEQREDVAGAMEDICWALLNSNEFLFQH